MSKHVRGLAYLLLAFVILLAFILGALVVKIVWDPGALNDIKYEFLFTAVAGLSTAIYKVWDVMDHRLGTVDLFSSEVLSICRILAVSRMIRWYVIWFHRPEFAKYVQETRREDYFSIYECSGRELGFLSRGVVMQITAFYTFLKGARDAAALLPSQAASSVLPPMETNAVQTTLSNIIYLLFLCLESAYYALDGLLEERLASRWKDIALHDLALAYAFLEDKVKAPDPRLHYLKNAERVRLFSEESNAIEAGKAEYKEVCGLYGSGAPD